MTVGQPACAPRALTALALALTFGYTGSTHAAGSVQIVRDFGTGLAGRIPISPLRLAPDGFYYGTTYAGGSAHGGGTVYRVSSLGRTQTVWLFPKPGNGEPKSAPVAGSDGALYGTAEGIWQSDGSIYRIASDGSVSTLHVFDGVPEGAYPRAGLMLASDGWLYGTTQVGGIASSGIDGDGTLFRVSAQGQFEVLHVFDPVREGGASPGPLVEAANGDLLGTLTDGNAIFRYTPSTGAFVILAKLARDESQGCSPNGGLLDGGDGWWYGVANSCGAHDYGTVYRVDDAGVVELVHAFDGVNDGGSPTGELIRASNGKLYGTAGISGTGGGGTVYSLNALGHFSVEHAFVSLSADGEGPAAGLVELPDGRLMGTTELGGTGSGTLYLLEPAR